MSDTLEQFHRVRDIIVSKTIRHIAVIMDGNRRWAKKHRKEGPFGHLEGVKALKEILKIVNDVGLKYLTIYAFSTENWQRSQKEVGFLMNLFINTLNKEIQELHEKNIKIKFIGANEEFPLKLQQLIAESELLTKDNSGVVLQIAANYGSRSEIIQAVKSIVNDIQNESLMLEEINEEKFASYLYTKDSPDPDILIRTGGDMRLSNYLLWQSAYSEIFVTETLWPDFSPTELLSIIDDFAQRERRFGKG